MLIGVQAGGHRHLKQPTTEYPEGQNKPEPNIHFSWFWVGVPGPPDRSTVTCGLLGR